MLRPCFDIRIYLWRANKIQIERIENGGKETQKLHQWAVGGVENG